MKKLFITLFASLGMFAASAQDDSLNNVRIVMNPEISCGHMVVASGYYAPLDESAGEATQHTWSLTPCDADGNPAGDPFFNQTYAGAPTTDFIFPESDLLPCDRHYKIRLEAVSSVGNTYSTSIVAWSSSAQSCVMGADVFNLEPGQSKTLWSTIVLPGGTYTYTVTNSGSTIISNLTCSVGPPNQPFTLQNQSAHVFNYSFTLFANAQLCASQTVTLKFFDNSSQLVCTHIFTVNCKRSPKQTVVNIPSGNCYGVYYKGDDDFIHRMYWANNQWNYQAVSVWGGWGNVRVDGWLNMDNPTNKIFFKGTDNKLYNLMLYPGTALVGAISSVANVKSDLQYRNEECVYIGTDNKIHRVYWDWGVSGWVYQAITPVGGWNGVTAAGGIALAPTWGSKNIFFRDQNDVIQNLYLWNGQWLMQPVTAFQYGTMYCDGEILFDETQSRLYFHEQAWGMHNVTYSAQFGWIYDPMTSVNGMIFPMKSITKNPGENRVFFKGPDSRGYAIWQQTNGQWRTDWLNGGYTNVLGDMVAGGNNIYFVSKSKEICNFWFPGSAVWWAGPLNFSTPANAIGCSTYYRFGDPETEPDGTSTSETTDAVTIFPNPNNGEFALQSVVPFEQATVELFDIRGARVDAFTISGTYYQYAPEEKLPPGLYLLRITDKGTQSTRRVIIE